MSYLPEKFPEDPESERALLATLCAPGADKAASFFAPMLEPADFVTPAHRALLVALQDVVNARQEVTPFSLKSALESHKDLDRLGGFEYYLLGRWNQIGYNYVNTA